MKIPEDLSYGEREKFRELHRFPDIGETPKPYTDSDLRFLLKCYVAEWFALPSRHVCRRRNYRFMIRLIIREIRHSEAGRPVPF